jgi:hypothetical protein
LTLLSSGQFGPGASTRIAGIAGFGQADVVADAMCAAGMLLLKVARLMAFYIPDFAS